LAVGCKLTSTNIPNVSLALLGTSSNNLLAFSKGIISPASFFPMKSLPPLAFAKPQIHLRYSSFQASLNSML